MENETYFEAKTAILYFGSRSGTRTTDLIAMNILPILRKSSPFAPLAIYKDKKQTHCKSR